ncbi:MAG: membrane protein insertase YidC [Bacteriovoracia bacterium]
MDKKALLAIALSLGIWVTWQKFYLEPIQHQQALENQRQQELVTQSQQRAEKRADLDQRGILPDSEKKRQGQVNRESRAVTLQNTDSTLVISNEPALVKSWQLKAFSTALEHQDDKISLAGISGFNGQGRLRFSDAQYEPASQQNWDSLVQENELSVVSKISTPAMQGLRRVVLDPQGYGGRVEYELQFAKDPPKYVFLDLYGSPKRENDHEGSIFGQAPDKVHVTFRDATGRHSEMAASLKQTKESAAGARWLGLDTRYFVLALVPEGSWKDVSGAQIAHDETRPATVRGTLVFPTDGKKTINFSTKMYFGPKHMESLRAVDPILSDAIDFGWTSVLAIPLLQALKWLYGYVHNYGLAIIILTFVIKMLLFPLTYKSTKSMAKIAVLQPQLNALREKFKDDKEKLNTEMMKFMKTNGYNPVGGCLPILLQMPIFFALYRVLFNSMELYQTPFYLWIHDLSRPDPFFITPVLLTGLMYVQQKLTPTAAADPAQQKMLQFMPLMFGVFMIMLPAGLNIYMVVNSAVTIAQQWVLTHKLGIKRPAPVVVSKA